MSTHGAGLAVLRFSDPFLLILLDLSDLSGLFLWGAGVIGRPRFEDQTLATWHRGSGIRMGWWPSSRCPLGDGAVGAPMTYGFLHGHLWILWAPSKWTTSGLRLQHGHGPYSIGSFRTISFCHF